jgi:hypothetical protein
MWGGDRRGNCRFGRRGDGRHAVLATSEFLIRRFIVFIDRGEFCVSAPGEGWIVLGQGR